MVRKADNRFPDRLQRYHVGAAVLVHRGSVVIGACDPGDYVECVDARPHGHYLIAPLQAGQVYIVRSVIAPDEKFPAGGLRLEGVPMPVSPRNIEAGWAPRRFRPVYRPKASLIESLLAPAPSAPVRVGEDA